MHPCVNQETKKRCQPGDIVNVGEMEMARLVADKLAVPMPDDNLRNAMVIPIEKRRRRNAG